MTTPKLVVVVGETASGKSALALRIAEQYNGELICSDSWTVRRELNIGSAKPTDAERQLVPHHLLDVVNPNETFTAATFKELATAAIDDITSRGKLPIMVGGTGLYIDGVIYDYNFLPVGDAAERAELDKLETPELLARMEAAGISTEGIDVHNKRRLVRLLQTKGAEQTKQELRSNTLILGLQTEREHLKERITARVDGMVEAGLEAEVRQLAERYGWNCEGLKGIGYQEWQDYFLGSQNLHVTKQRIVTNTARLAKRQRTWFKRNKSIHWLATPVNYTQVDDLVTTFLNK